MAATSILYGEEFLYTYMTGYKTGHPQAERTGKHSIPKAEFLVKKSVYSHEVYTILCSSLIVFHLVCVGSRNCRQFEVRVWVFSFSQELLLQSGYRKTLSNC